ncbi:hypothetical protein HQ545_07985 [Candidatus Woesearchaeota archaeon]|nr:hypothetical protein [Candidatus Woesearchaeota archaeon]
MVYDLLIMGLQWINIVVLFIAAGFSITAVGALIRHKTRIMQVKHVVFELMCAGVWLLAIGLLLLRIKQSFLSNIFPSIADMFLIFGYVCLVFALGYFWYHAGKMHKLHKRDMVFIFGTTCGVLLWLYFLFVVSIIPAVQGLPLLHRSLHYIYPVLTSLMFLFSLAIHPRMKAKLIRTPLWYLSSGVFAYFIGTMMIEYSRWNAVYGFMPVLYSSVFLIGSFYFLLGFVSAKRKYE